MDKFTARQRGFAPPPVLIIGGVVVLAIVFFIATGALKTNVQVGKSDQAGTSPTSSEQTGPKSYEAEKYTLEYPGNWTIQEAARYVGFYSAKENSGDAFVENIIISADDVESQKPGVTLDEVADSWIRQNRNDMPGGVMGEAENTTLAGITAKTVTYTFTNEGIDVKGTAIISLKDGIAYVLVYTAEAKSYDKFLEGLTQITSSFEIK